MYEYIADKASDLTLSESSRTQAQAIRRQMEMQYPMTIRLPYSCLATPRVAINVLKKSALLRRIKQGPPPRYQGSGLRLWLWLEKRTPVEEFREAEKNAFVKKKQVEYLGTL